MYKFYDLSQELLLNCELEVIITIFSPAPAFTPILPENKGLKVCRAALLFLLVTPQRNVS